jgi:hypothetical protein
VARLSLSKTGSRSEAMPECSATLRC